MTTLVVHRGADRILILVPNDTGDDVRHHAMIGEDESFCASSAVKRMATMREDATIEVGEPADKLRIDKVGHAALPFEIVFEDADGRMVLDLRRDEAMILADMLWGAHRSASFYMSVTIPREPRRTPTPDVVRAWRVDPADAARTRLIGDARRRARGEEPEPK